MNTIENKYSNHLAPAYLSTVMIHFAPRLPFYHDDSSRCDDSTAEGSLR